MPFKTVAVLALLLFGFSAGAFTAALRGWGSPEVHIEVENRSGQAIRSVSVRYNTCGISGTLVVSELAVDQSKTVHFSACGEGAYSVEIEFPDERRIRNAEQYVESGHSNKIVVSLTGISLNQRFYGL